MGALRVGSAGLAAAAWLLAAPGCIYPEPLYDDDADDDDTGDDDTGDDDTGDDDTGDDDTDDDDTDDDDTVDGDGDGWSADEGDCNDQDPDVYPGAAELCDALDNDCNGIVNDGTTGYDLFEPDDEEGADLGELTDSETWVDTYLQAPDDVDRFQFWVDDESDITGDGFFVYAELQYVPAAVDVSLTINRLTDPSGAPWVIELGTVNHAGFGGGEFLAHEGVWGSNDDGRYEIVVTAVGGFDCDEQYELYIECGS